MTIAAGLTHRRSLLALGGRQDGVDVAAGRLVERPHRRPLRLGRALAVVDRASLGARALEDRADAGRLVAAQRERLGHVPDATVEALRVPLLHERLGLRPLSGREHLVDEALGLFVERAHLSTRVLRAALLEELRTALARAGEDRVDLGLLVGGQIELREEVTREALAAVATVVAVTAMAALVITLPVRRSPRAGRPLGGHERRRREPERCDEGAVAEGAEEGARGHRRVLSFSGAVIAGLEELDALDLTRILTAGVDPRRPRAYNRTREHPMKNPCAFPEPLLAWIDRSFTCELGTITSAGLPLTYPITPHASLDGRTIDLATGLAYPLKAERARRHPKVGLLFSDPTGTGMRDAPIVLVKGEATVRDADLQANTDRYVAISMAKFATLGRFLPRSLHRTGTWYYARIWIHVTPLEILVFPGGDTDREPEVWKAAPGTQAPPSDPPPEGRVAPAGKAFEAPPDFHEALAHAVAHLGAPVLTVVDEAGFPIPTRMRDVRLEGSDLVAIAPRHRVAPLRGRACVTFHTHPERFTSQENLVFTGEALETPEGARVRIERQIGSFSLGRSPLDTLRTVLGRGKDLHRRMRMEAARRGQPVPEVRLPGDERLRSTTRSTSRVAK